MASDDDGTEIGSPRVRASLRIELETGERQVVATFREGILRWLNDRSGSAFGRSLGAPDRLSFEEVQASSDGLGTPTVRLDVSWSQADDPQATRVVFAPDQAQTLGADIPIESLVFFPDPPGRSAPIYRALEVPLGFAPQERSAERSPQLRIRTPAGAMIDNARRFADSVEDSVLGGRVPAADRARVKGFAVLGLAAVVAGFLVGTVYLASRRPSVPPVQVTARADTPQETPAARPVSAPPAVQASVPTPTTPMTPPTREPAAGPAVPSVPAPHVVIPARVRAAIPDTEVRRPRPAARAAKPVALRRPGPVVVRAIGDARVTAAGSGTRRGIGALLVGSDPQGAEVSINGIVHGRTPLMIRGLGAGSRVVRLELPGYRRWSWAVAVVADKQTPVTVKLQPESRGAASQQ